MTMIVCKECKGELSSKASICPHCGAPRRTNPAIWIFGCGAMLVGALLMSFVIVAAITVPQLLRSRMAANEAYAVAMLRSIAMAQNGFLAAGLVDKNEDGVSDYGTLDELAHPPGDNTGFSFIDAGLATGEKNGYRFQLDVVYGDGTARPAFACVAKPIVPGRTGFRQFFVDETRVIRFTGDGTDVSATSNPL